MSGPPGRNGASLWLRRGGDPASRCRRLRCCTSSLHARPGSYLYALTAGLSISGHGMRRADLHPLATTPWRCRCKRPPAPLSPIRHTPPPLLRMTQEMVVPSIAPLALLPGYVTDTARGDTAVRNLERQNARPPLTKRKDAPTRDGWRAPQARPDHRATIPRVDLNARVHSSPGVVASATFSDETSGTSGRT